MVDLFGDRTNFRSYGDGSAPVDVGTKTELEIDPYDLHTVALGFWEPGVYHLRWTADNESFRVSSLELNSSTWQSGELVVAACEDLSYEVLLTALSEAPDQPVRVTLEVEFEKGCACERAVRGCLEGVWEMAPDSLIASVYGGSGDVELFEGALRLRIAPDGSVLKHFDEVRFVANGGALDFLTDGVVAACFRAVGPGFMKVNEIFDRVVRTNIITHEGRGPERSELPGENPLTRWKGMVRYTCRGDILKIGNRQYDRVPME